MAFVIFTEDETAMIRPGRLRVRSFGSFHRHRGSTGCPHALSQRLSEVFFPWSPREMACPEFCDHMNKFVKPDEL